MVTVAEKHRTFIATSAATKVATEGAVLAAKTAQHQLLLQEQCQTHKKHLARKLKAFEFPFTQAADAAPSVPSRGSSSAADNFRPINQELFDSFQSRLQQQQPEAAAATVPAAVPAVPVAAEAVPEVDSFHTDPYQTNFDQEVQEAPSLPRPAPAPRQRQQQASAAAAAPPSRSRLQVRELPYSVQTVQQKTRQAIGKGIKLIATASRNKAKH